MELLKVIQEQQLDDFNKIKSFMVANNITCKEHGSLYLLMYSIKTDFKKSFTRCCRGIILEKNTNRIVCYPFDKFFNYGERFADQIDSQSATYLEKMDGSIIKLYYYNDQWNVATNGCIDARNAKVYNLERTFFDLFQDCQDQIHLDRLDINNTYIFELCHPESKTIVKHQIPKLYHIGTRSNMTYRELDVDIGVTKPRKFDFHDIEECLKNARLLMVEDDGNIKYEGYVVVDKYYRRNKVKSPTYVKLHNGGGAINIENLIDIIKNNEVSEYLTYFPKLSEYIASIENYIQTILDDCQKLLDFGYKNRKEFYLHNQEKPYIAFLMICYSSGQVDRDNLLHFKPLPSILEKMGLNVGSK